MCNGIVTVWFLFLSQQSVTNYFSFTAADHQTDSFIELYSATPRSRVQPHPCVYFRKAKQNKTKKPQTTHRTFSQHTSLNVCCGNFICYFIIKLFITDTFAVPNFMWLSLCTKTMQMQTEITRNKTSGILCRMREQREERGRAGIKLWQRNNKGKVVLVIQSFW